MKDNKGGPQKTTDVSASSEWRAYDSLPPKAREIAREFCLFDYSAEQLLQVWNSYCYQNLTKFKDFMQQSDRQVIDDTKGDWPTPSVRKTTAYERAIARTKDDPTRRS